MHTRFFLSSLPSHLLTRGNGDVTHFTLGDNGGWKKATGREGWWEERGGGGEGLSRGLKKHSVLFTMDTMSRPPRLEHNNTCGFKFLPPPRSLSLSSRSSLPLIHHMAAAQRHEFPMY